MATKENRWFDEGDFTTDHDQIFQFLIGGGWLRIVLWHFWKGYISGSLNSPDGDNLYNYYKTSKNRTTKIIGKFEGEPIIEGYPPVFPDGIIIADVKGTNGNKKEWVETHNYCIEIKPEIDNFAKVLRQLNIYRTRRKALPIVLITKNNKYDKMFQEQNIQTIHPKQLMWSIELKPDYKWDEWGELTEDAYKAIRTQIDRLSGYK